MTNEVTVFDRDLVRRRRDRAATHLDDFDFLFMEGAERLCDRLLDINRDFPLGVDLGCHGGEIARCLTSAHRVGTLIQADLSPRMAALARGNTGSPAVCADEEFLPFKDAGLDMVVSNLSLHWVNDLPGTLTQIRRALKPDGLFLASMFGLGTLAALRDALAEAEIEIDGGLSPRVSPFADVRDLGALLQRAGFALPVVDTDTITVNYAEPMRLLADLRGMGESNATQLRRREPLKRSVLMTAMAKYFERHATDDGRLPATFEIITLTAWAPAPTQQKPLQPGSAKGRLADALDTEEVKLSDK